MIDFATPHFSRVSLPRPTPHPLGGGGVAKSAPHLPHLATPHLSKCGNTPGKWELSLPYAFRRRDMLVGSVAIFLAGSWVRRLAIGAASGSIGCGSISPSA